MFFSAFKSNITYYPVFKEQSLRVDLSKLNKVSTLTNVQGFPYYSLERR